MTNIKGFKGFEFSRSVADLNLREWTLTSDGNYSRSLRADFGTGTETTARGILPIKGKVGMYAIHWAFPRDALALSSDIRSSLLKRYDAKLVSHDDLTGEGFSLGLGGRLELIDEDGDHIRLVDDGFVAVTLQYISADAWKHLKAEQQREAAAQQSQL